MSCRGRTRRVVRAAATLLLAGAVLVAAGCARSARDQGPPPPRGKSMDAYLADPRPPRPPRPPRDDADVMRLHVIDVGQGAAQLLEFPCGAILVDTGGEKNAQFDSEPALIGYLDRFFERRHDLDRTLALLVVTHPHIDHTRGIAAVLERYRVLNVLDNGDVREDEGGKPQLAMHQWLSQHPRVGHMDLGRGDIDGRDAATGPVIDPVGACAMSDVDPIVRALWSSDLGREEVGQNPNNDSVVVRVDFGDASVLLPGDIELLAIARLIRKFKDNPRMLDVDIYVVPHHGSRYSTTADLLAQVSPEVAVISAGPYERDLPGPDAYTARAFAHPNQVAIDQLTNRRSGVSGTRPKPVEVWVGQRGAWKSRPSQFQKRTVSAAVYSTGWDGTVVVTAYANGFIEVATER
ncbi:MAG TPA: MBL fold metallo-hydrolase [Kofleriaceae bacterium]|nr:MBL fold metallo-hydrolase [Kofleriaceae bacterium]